MRTEIAVHSGKDSYKRPLVADRDYMVTRPGAKAVRVQTFEDACGDIWISGLEPRAVRVDELAPDAVLSRVDSDTPLDVRDLESVETALHLAAHAREHLAICEAELCKHLGCVMGDGSPVWDGISAAVRDGMGTAVDLLDLAGSLRR